MTFQRTEDVCVNLLRSAYTNARPPAVWSVWSGACRSAFLSRPGSSVRRLSTLPRSHRSLDEQRTPCGSPDVAVSIRRQQYATARKRPREIAVLGAGITGLTAAHYLARYAAPGDRITIYEASDRPGGWIKADRVDVKDEQGQPGHVLLQSGPRMLRSSSSSYKYDDLVLYDVLASLNMGHKIRHPQPVSGTRYLYYPDHLVKLPSEQLSTSVIAELLYSYLTEPLWSGALKAGYNYWTSYNMAMQPLFGDNGRFAMPKPVELPEDESVAQFFTRICDDDRIVKNIISAMVHGIYAGDINQLSVKHTLFYRHWYHFKKPIPRNTPGAENLTWVDRRDDFLINDMLSGPNRFKIIELAESAVEWGLLAFEDGLLSLVNGLVKDLERRSNVTFKYGKPVTSLKHENGEVLVKTSKAKQAAKYDHVICTLFSKQLAQIAEPQNSLPSLAETHAVTVMVVNLWYPSPNLLAERGFGYLIPSSTPDNDEGALGVLFDSDLRTDDGEVPGTKLTVMLGGHHWDGWEHYPSEETGIAMAKEVVRRQLRIEETDEVVARAHLCRDCLPQHFVGHRERMRDAHYELLSTFQGHLTVAGPSYTTIGVVPAMRAGFDAGMRVARGYPQPWFRLPRDKRRPPSAQAQPREWDYWGSEPGITEDGGEVADVIGTTGLEHFTEDEWAALRGTPRGQMLFRNFTDQNRRFRDEYGQYLDLDKRKVKNSPPQHKQVGKFQLKWEDLKD